jgi:hypothetical protein
VVPLLEPTLFVQALARKKGDVVNYPDGRIKVQFYAVSVPGVRQDPAGALRIFPSRPADVRTLHDAGCG